MSEKRVRTTCPHCAIGNMATYRPFCYVKTIITCRYCKRSYRVSDSTVDFDQVSLCMGQGVSLTDFMRLLDS